MKPTVGPAHVIIAQALELGILCRPRYTHCLGGVRVATGEALEVSADMFWHVNGNDAERKVFTVTPSELLVDWELTTPDLIRAEWHKSCESW